MSLENAKKFMERLKEDASLQERLADARRNNLLKIARENGFSVSAEDLKQALSTNGSGDGVIPDAEVEGISGGSGYRHSMYDLGA